MNNPSKPAYFALQWHITERCNWRCKHCYQESYATSEMSMNTMKGVLNQYVALIKKWGIAKRHAEISITGGEPMIRDDFFQFLEEVQKLSKYFSLNILSNGSFLTKDNVKKLKLLGIENFQVSLEGLEKSNDEIRGEGSFQKTLKAIDLLRGAKIPAVVSVTLSKKNSSEIEEMAEILDPLGVKNISARRIVPFGSGTQLKDSLLEPKELKKFYKKVKEINRNFIKNGRNPRIGIGCESAIFNDELSELNSTKFNLCGVTDGRVIVLMPNGDFFACRRLPVKIGNIYEKSLEEVYYSSLYKAWRKGYDISGNCRSCSNFAKCFGGAKCVTYAMTGKTTPDVQCWKLFNSLDEAIERTKNPKYGVKIYNEIRKFFIDLFIKNA